MTLQAIIIGVFALLLGIGFTFYGIKFFIILLPIWGFFVGFIAGANIVTNLFGDGFLSTFTSWFAGLVLGAIFAALSYLYYYFAVVILGGGLGYMLGMGLMAWLGNGGGWLAFTVAMVFAIVFAVAFIVLQMPIIIAIVATAIAGASAIVVGLALALGRVPLEALNYGTAGAYVKDNLGAIWIVLGVVLAIAGAWYQSKSVVASVDQIEASRYRNPGMPVSS
jgi:Domain of unknown function (DUF4203)